MAQDGVKIESDLVEQFVAEFGAQFLRISFDKTDETTVTVTKGRDLLQDGASVVSIKSEIRDSLPSEDGTTMVPPPTLLLIVKDAGNTQHRLVIPMSTIKNWETDEPPRIPWVPEGCFRIFLAQELVIEFRGLGKRK